jgi:hypothetical protein
MEVLVKNFWKELKYVLQLLAAQLLAGHADFKFHIGSSSNSVFPLRAYLTILKSNEGNELSITVDIKNLEDGLLIESDVVGEEGVIVADGPSLELRGDLSKPATQVKIDEWFKSFDLLIEEKSSDIETSIKNLG